MQSCINKCLLAIVFVSTCVPAIHAQEWKAGVAKAKITPLQPMPMAGYASRGAEHAKGLLTDLWAKALYLNDGKQEAVIITLDLIGIDRELSNQISMSIQQEHGWQPHQISLCTSHTHTGPVVAKNLRPMHYMMFNDEDQKLVMGYAKFLHETIVKLVEQARARQETSSLTWGSGTATFATNRRNNPEAEVVELRKQDKLTGPFDHDVPVLCVEQAGKLKAILFGYACHCTTLSSFEWSGDYAGFAQIELELKHPDCIAMFWAGCGGDQNPLPRRTVELAKEYGARLATAVESVIASKRKDIPPQLGTQGKVINLKLATLPDRQKLTEEAASSNKYYAARAKYLLKQLDETGTLPRSYPYPIFLWKLGEKSSSLNFVFLGGEVVIDYALRIKEETGLKEFDHKNTWVAAYSNDVMAYIPSLRVLNEGGYEGGGAMVYYGLPTVWAPEVEMYIMEAVHLLLKNSQ